MKTSKKIIITAALVLIIAICGTIVYFVKPTQKMLVGGIYNGSNITKIIFDSEDSDYNTKNISELEKLMAKNTSIMIVEMRSEAGESGTAVLRISSPDIEGYIAKNKLDISASNEEEFKNSFNSQIYELLLKNKITAKTEPQLIEVEMQFIKSSWKLVPNNNLRDALTGNIANIAHTAWTQK